MPRLFVTYLTDQTRSDSVENALQGATLALNHQVWAQGCWLINKILLKKMNRVDAISSMFPLKVTQN